MTSEFPQYSDRGKQWHPIVAAVFKHCIAERVFFQVPVNTADITTIEYVGDFDERQQGPALHIETPANSKVEARECGVPKGVPLAIAF